MNKTSPPARRRPTNPALDRFCNLLIAYSGNRKRAYREAFPNANADNQVENTNISRLMRYRYVREKLAALQASDQARIEALRERLREELSYLSFSRITDVVRVEGDTVQVRDDISDSAFAAVQEIVMTETQTQAGTNRHIKVKLVPKVEALRATMDHYGLKEEPAPPSMEFDVSFTAVATVKTDEERRRENLDEQHRQREGKRQTQGFKPYDQTPVDTDPVDLPPQDDTPTDQKHPASNP